MKRKKFAPQLRAHLGGLLLAALGVSLNSPAADVLFTNSGFDTAAPGWSWEDWSAPGSSVAFDAAQNSAVSGGAAASGSLELNNNFTAAASYQQAVFTAALPAPQDFNNQIGAISFDVRVDPASIARAEGDYGFLEVILRQGSGWTWVGLPGVRLNGTEWQRVTFQVPKTGVDSIRAVTLKLGDENLLGPVTLNIDNISYFTTPDDVFITGADNGAADVVPEGWAWENWSVSATISSDPMDVIGRATSGSIKIEQAFTNLPNSYQQSVVTYVLPGGTVDAAQEYSHVNLDVRVAPGSIPRATGDYGYWEIFLRNGTGWDWLATAINGAGGIRLTNTEWQRLSFKVPASAGAVHRLTFKTGDNALLGPITLNIDNITWTRNTAPPPPPSLNLERAQGGLNLVTTSSDPFGRHNIYTTDNTSYAFAGSSEPVSYSFTIDKFPDAAAYPGFQAHIFLVPGSPGTETSPDWNQPTLIYMDIKAGANNTGNATFRIKTEQPGGNNELYAGGPRTNVNSATILGTWTLTANGQIFTMTAPDGTVSGPIDIDAEAAALFADGNLRVYFGAQPNADGNKGQSIHVAKTEIKRGSTILLSDDFSGEALDLEKWTANASAGGVFFVPQSGANWVVTWTLPDAGFKLQATSSLTNPNWTDLDVSASTVTIGLTRQATIPVSALPPGPTVFLRMVQVPIVDPAP